MEQRLLCYFNVFSIGLTVFKSAEVLIASQLTLMWIFWQRQIN